MNVLLTSRRSSRKEKKKEKKHFVEKIEKTKK